MVDHDCFFREKGLISLCCYLRLALCLASTSIGTKKMLNTSPSMELNRKRSKPSVEDGIYRNVVAKGVTIS